MFAVVIPYFQRESGILRNALRSIADQDVREEVRVYVVDDESPAPPEAEVAAVAWPANLTFRVLKKTNGGPASARNAGLDALGPEDGIAFLDSDDRWLPHHLAAARYAFDEGFDYYTADWVIDDDGTRAFDALYGDRLRLRPHAGSPWAFELVDELINYSVCGPIGSPCSMVVRRSLVGDLRFDESLRTAGEDGLFATRLAARLPRVLVSRRIDTVLGRGVNIFSTGDWRSREAAMRALYFLRSRLLMKPLAAGHPIAAERLAARIRGAREDVWRGVLAARGRNYPWHELLVLCRDDPALLIAGPGALARVVGDRAAASR